MSYSLFPVLSLDRSLSRWEEHLAELTPCERLSSGGWVKREDTFAPLGYGGINGAKLRQMIHLVGAAWRAGKDGILTGASVLSPQLSSAALTAAHFGLPCHIVLGGTTVAQAARTHEQVAIAVAAGASFSTIPVGYNPALQAEVRRLLALPVYATWSRLPYAISLPEDAAAADLDAFHALGAHQVRNVPPDVSTLHLAAGSCNTAASVLCGIGRGLAPQIERLVLYQIGPSRRDWLTRRLAALDVSWSTLPPVEWIDVHGAGVDYSRRLRATLDVRIVLHPTYEGKILHARAFRSFGPGELFWIVGSEPHLTPMRALLPRAAVAV